jgi:hypothetical protein
VTYQVRVSWGHLKAGSVVSAEMLAGCNMAALVARGVIAPVLDQPRPKRMPAKPVKAADEPKEQD